MFLGIAFLIGNVMADVDPSITAPRRVKVLFLGDEGHHQPLERCRQVYSLLAEHGIDLTYTEDLRDLNPANLDRFDALLLYANWTSIAPEQERALIDYVEGGHGFVPIHCGSYCFLNSPRITALIGARFKSHGTGVFKETIALPDHPIEQGLNPIESWDESYVHEMHNEKDRTVLSYRVQGDHKEPYTWVRTQGKGRVFYTAWGHDQRTWGNPDFQALLERGIRWAAGDWALQPQPALPAFQYTRANLPNYIPNAPWGTTGDPIGRMQEPVGPRESMLHMVLPPGFGAKLVAAEPDIKKPICMAFDERGRLWVAETFDYPNNMQKPGDGHDQITICDDFDAEGKARKFTVFADKLSIPTGLCFANGGVIVAQAPDILFLKSSAGDDHCDQRKVLFHGFGTRDTHATVSNLRYGFDNWIYATVGYSGFRGDVNGKPLSFGQGVFRFKADGSAMEFLGSTTNNTWGLGLSEDGQVFGSTANGNPSWYLSIPNRYYEQAKGWPVSRLETIADSWKFYPVTEKVRQVDNFGGYTAGAGHALYTARSFPRNYWNRIAFVNEPTGHLIGQFELIPDGSGFKARDDFNLFASTDEWTAPIAAEVGPDGAVWMIDWYNIVVQHNPIPRGFVAGKGAAYETPLRDKRHGRVYRLIWDGAKPSKSLNLANATTEQLVDALKSDNMLWRMHGQRLLIERGGNDAIPALIKLVEDRTLDEIGLNPAAIHALWTLHGLGAFEGSHARPEAIAAAIGALHHPCAAVREAAADVLPRTADAAQAIVDAKLLGDDDAQVRKSALLALTQVPPTEQAGAAIFASLHRKGNVNDRWISDASALAACLNDAGFLKAVFAAHPAASADVATSEASVNLVANSSFERSEGAQSLHAGWKVRHYSGQAMQYLDASAHTGACSLRIDSTRGADSSLYLDVPVDPNTDYLLSGWIRTQDLKVTDGLGALLNVHLTDIRTPAVKGTSDWQEVQVRFNSGERRSVSINCLFGGWGRATGSAWFDDVKLTRAASMGLPGIEGRVLGIVMDQYAQRGPVDSVVSTLMAARNSAPALANVVVNALASNWPQGVAPQIAEADAGALHEVMNVLAPAAKDRLLALAARWGRADLFASEMAAATRSLRAAITDASLPASARADSARRLISIDDSPASIALVMNEINAKTGPDTQLGLLDALGTSRDPAVGSALVKQYGQFTPTAQRAALNLMLRRVPWTGALVAGIESRAIESRDLLNEQWQALFSNPDRELAQNARALQRSTGRAPTADRKELVDRMMPLAQRPGGDAQRGRQVFEKNCMVCHTIEGHGGQVGPDLTGMGARPKSENLIDILDPNRSVEGTYRQWTIKTKDEVISGRLFAESQTSIEIIDATAQRHVIDRANVQVLKSTDRSVMPEGFEALGNQALQDLLAYIDTSKVKH
jgi:putative membrane-bound dehydrogenase-like protein